MAGAWRTERNSSTSGISASSFPATCTTKAQTVTGQLVVSSKYPALRVGWAMRIFGAGVMSIEDSNWTAVLATILSVGVAEAATHPLTITLSFLPGGTPSTV